MNAETGGTSGTFEWLQTKVLPLGMFGVFGIDWVSEHKWHYYGNSSRLEALFWLTFYIHVGKISDDDKYAMKSAERPGLVHRYDLT